jgi:proteic killer suppression protein
MIKSFKNRAAEDIFNGKSTKTAIKLFPKNLWKIIFRKFDQLDSVLSLNAPGNRLEALSGNREGQHSIRINDQYRICFKWIENEPHNVEITDYH